MISEHHPYWHVKSVVEAHPEVESVPLSYYTYTPRTVADERTTFLVKVCDFLNPLYVDTVLAETPPGQELAIHSDLRLSGGRIGHLVMIDMSTSSMTYLETLHTFLDDNRFQRVFWYMSGRSFHGYGENLLMETDWVKFMGLLLLANQPNQEPTVDSRWIGHRLLAGFSALRWTHNTDHYLAQPSAVKATSKN